MILAFCFEEGEGGLRGGGDFVGGVAAEVCVDGFEAANQVHDVAAFVGSTRFVAEMGTASEGAVGVEGAEPFSLVEKGAVAVLGRRDLRTPGFPETSRKDDGFAESEHRFFSCQAEAAAPVAQDAIAGNAEFF